METKISDPCCITPRLLPGVKIGDAFVSISYDEKPGDQGRTRYRYYIDTPNLEYTCNDVQSGCQGGNLQEGLESLLSFLSACGESVSCSEGKEAGENADLFTPEIGEWCSENQDELSMAAYDLEETPNLIQEDYSK